MKFYKGPSLQVPVKNIERPGPSGEVSHRASGAMKEKKFLWGATTVGVLVRAVEAATDPLHNGDEFSNNLFSDLAPLLTLFGEQVTKQFMSQSMSWADHITFAMAPLGVVTGMIGAIRVGGPTWLKAIIGRARENRAMAEVELMSSTSHEVCELWNGWQTVRLMGSPMVCEVLWFLQRGCDRPNGQDLSEPTTLEEAKVRGFLKRHGTFQ